MFLESSFLSGRVGFFLNMLSTNLEIWINGTTSTMVNTNVKEEVFLDLDREYIVFSYYFSYSALFALPEHMYSRCSALP